jgi:hypothetical protein
MMTSMTEEPQGMEAPATAHVQVNVDPAGPRTVLVNGDNWTRYVREVHLSVQGMQPPRVLMVAAPDTSYAFEGPGIVTVVQEKVTGWQARAGQWLADLNWTEIQARAAAGSMSVPLGEAFRDVLLSQLRTELDD